jgi:RNA polymerase sigma-70 factor (ECF subfamily)
MKEFDKKYRRSVEKFVSQKIEDAGLVEEITNDVLWSAWESRENFNHKCEEFSWICSIAKHKIIDYYRKKKIKQVLFSNNPVYEEIADKALTPERDALKNELLEEIKDTFAELNEGYGKLLRLKYVDGLKISEISKMLKISLKAVESRLSRAKKQFREAWNYDRKEI